MRWTTEAGRPADVPRVTRCANCDIEIDGEPVERDQRTYCCEGCALGGPCVC